MMLEYYGSTGIYANEFQIMILIVFLLISPLLRFFREFLAVETDIEEVEELTSNIFIYIL